MAVIYAETPTVVEKKEEFTLREAIEAIRINGIPQVVGELTSYDNTGKLVGACAMGQAAINLGWEPREFEMYMGGIYDTATYSISRKDFIAFCKKEDELDLAAEFQMNGSEGNVSFTLITENLNDNREWSYTHIADFLDKLYADRLDKKVEM